MCLYGHDLDESVSPIEAGLAWLVGESLIGEKSVEDGYILRYMHSAGKDRRAAGDFPGASRILRELKEGPARRRVGFEITGSPAREGCEILTVDEGSIIGKYRCSRPTRLMA
jgi:aminomethyltransferase